MHMNMTMNMITDRNPLPNPNPTPNPHPAPRAKTPSFEEVSKLFSLPLSDAAETLGVCPSVLKNICYDNGLVRWPYRQFLFGKSIEEIKNGAAIEKKKHAELKVAGERSDSLAISAVSSYLGSQPLSTNTGSSQESPLRMLTQQPMKDNQIESSKEKSPIVDEFKYGFPSGSLSHVSFRWWGNKSSDDDGADDQQSGGEDAEKKKQQAKDSQDTAANSPSTDGEATKGKKNETDVGSQWASKLTALRKKAAEDGRQALKLGVYRGQSSKTLDKNKKKVLRQVFKSYLPSEWGDLSES